MPASGVLQDRAIEAALGIARMIAESAIHVGSSATWLHFGHNQRIRQQQVQQIGLDIYEGTCGIALFLAAAGMISGDDRYRELAIAASLVSLWHNSPSAQRRAWERLCTAFCASANGPAIKRC